MSGREPPNDGHEVRFPTGIYNTLSTSSESLSKKKKLLVEYKGGNCQVCKYDRCIDNLTFHHLDPSKKDFQISGTSKAFETLKAEVDKCVLLCKNCHGEVHAGLLQI